MNAYTNICMFKIRKKNNFTGQIEYIAGKLGIR